MWRDFKAVGTVKEEKMKKLCLENQEKGVRLMKDKRLRLNCGNTG